jgi:GDP-mannose 6-dehydrogenase
MRSTVLPGTAQGTVLPLLAEHSGKRLGEGYLYASNPEFLREGTAIHDFFNPPKTVIGESDEQAGRMLAGLYSELDAPLIRTSVPTAEMVKYADNVWHAVKVSFANEIGNIAKEVGVDGQDVMDIFCQDSKLNLSTYYLKPGFAFGGSCLPKDVRALVSLSRSLQLPSPLINSVMASNRSQIDRALALIGSAGKQRIGLLGLSFKPDTDDVRESPQLALAERLLDEGYELAIYDSHVYDSVHGVKKSEHAVRRLQRVVGCLVEDLDVVLAAAQVVVIGNGDRGFMNICDRVTDKPVVDLVRVSEQCSNERYTGICW